MSEDFIDLRVLVQVVRRWWLLLLLGPVIGGVVGLGVSLGFSEAPAVSEPVGVARQYEASTVVAVEGTSILRGVPDLVATKPVLEDAINDLGRSITVAQLRGSLSAEIINGSALVRITAVDSDPDLAVNIADAVAQSLVDHIVAYQEPRIALAQEELTRRLARLDLDSIDGQALADAMVVLGQVIRRPVIVTPAELVNGSAEELVAPLVPSGGATVIRNLLIGIFVGVVLSVLVVFLMEYFQNPIRTADQFESKFGLTRMGTLPKRPKRRNQSLSLPVADESTPEALETIRQLATSVAFTIEERHIDTVAIASPETRDGRSSLTANLGVALAGSWKNVVLVDADLRCPTLHNYFNADNTTGLSDFLANPDLEVEQILQDTRYNRLKIIPSGPLSTNPVELLSSPRMRWLLEQLKETTDVVLLDTPPLLAVTDGVVVSNQVGGVILLVNGPNNGNDHMKAAVANLERAGTPILGYVWNAMTTGIAGKSPQPYQYYRRFTKQSWRDTKLGSEPRNTGVESYSNGASVGEAPST